MDPSTPILPPLTHPSLESSIMYDYSREMNPYFIRPPESTRQPSGHPSPPAQSPLPGVSPPRQQPDQPSQKPPHSPQSQVPLSTVPPLPRPQPGDHYPIHDRNRPLSSKPVAPPQQITRPPSAQGAPPPQRNVPVDQQTEPEEIVGDRHPQKLRNFPEQKTRFPIWFVAIFCAIFWLIIIVGGLIVLIVYLVFRPHVPRFDIPAASLNAAYLDLGTYLDADITLLVNFTNPNKKVRVDFSSVILDLYYGNNPIATQYIEPFSAGSHESRFAHAHMISSEVRLPSADSQRLSAQLESNGLVMFEVRGLFRTRSNLGTFLRYSYWLHGHCNISFTGPPAGVLRASKCWTKR